MWASLQDADRINTDAGLKLTKVRYEYVIRPEIGDKMAVTTCLT